MSTFQIRPAAAEDAEAILRVYNYRAALAPMAGVADRALRELCMESGAQFCCGEMVSAMGVFCGDRKSAQLMEIHDAERPCGIQLFGKEPHTFPRAVEAALRHGPAFIDLNMGCPAHKVAGHGGGAALMKSPGLARRIVEETVRAVAGEVPVSVKMRAGWDETNRNAVEIARICEQAGAARLTVHGRLRAQMYAPPVDLDIIRDVKQAVRVPVVGNGDVMDGPSASHMLEYTGCDAVMAGRGAMGRPWVFARIAAYLKDGAALPEPPVEARLETMLRHVRLLCEYKGARIGMMEARKHAAWYLRGLRGGAGLRRAVVGIESIEQLEEIAEQCLRME
ncbi:MAG: tRNA dihydrouridine synthase DusB [Oscillospiraceae bacterium]|jgi:nifR3 family TIM-barrel protein|nr:tRNA dihydrouridine synthase DusB [Oscillospiraceae bacterium]